jgi:hypothetical protein
MSKKRSGFANDRKGYYICCNNNNNIPVPFCPPISLSTIATADPNPKVNNWILNADTTILACQTLIIPSRETFTIPGNLTLTNNGTILVQGTRGFIDDYGTIINNQTIEVNGGSLMCKFNEELFTQNSFINNGTINLINSSLSISTPNFINNGIINNDIDSIISVNLTALSQPTYKLNNNGTINNNRGQITINSILSNYIPNAVINNHRGNIYSYSSGTITNAGIINNIGTITNDSTFIDSGVSAVVNNFSIIINNVTGIFFVNNGATVNSTFGLLSFTNDGTVNIADGTSTCGIGFFHGVITGTGTQGNACI